MQARLLMLAACLPSGLAQTDNAAEQVKQAMEAVRRGDSSQIAGLQRLAGRAAPFLAPYVRDPSVDVRREAVMFLGLSGAPAAMLPVAEALSDASPDIRQRASQLLYERFQPQNVAVSADVIQRLRKAACAESLPGVILLLGWAPGAESERCLQATLQERKSESVKLSNDSLPVPASLPAIIALSRLGNQSARVELIGTIGKGSIESLLFVLHVLRDIDAPEVLHSLKPALRDTREVQGGVPSGFQPARRVCDVAATALIRRLTLKLDFPVTDAGRYPEAQLEQVRRRMDQALPQ